VWISSVGGNTLTRDEGSPPIRFFYLNQSSSVLTLLDITLTNGDANANDGGTMFIYGSNAKATIENTTFSDNQVRYGGAITINRGSPTFKVNISCFLSNYVTTGGGKTQVCGAQFGQLALDA